MRELIYFFLLFFGLSLSAMEQTKPDPSKNTDGICHLARVPTDVLNNVLMRFILHETDEEFVARAKRNHATSYPRALRTQRETKYGKLTIDVTPANIGLISLITASAQPPLQIYEESDNFHYGKGNHYQMELNISRDHSKIFFIHALRLRYGNGNFTSYSNIEFYDLALKKCILSMPQLAGKAFSSTLSGSGAYMAHLSESFPNIFINIRNCQGKQQFFLIDLPKPVFLAFNKQETKIAVLSGSGAFKLISLNELIILEKTKINDPILLEETQKPKVSLKEYLHRNRVCKDLQFSLKNQKCQPQTIPSLVI